MRIAVLTVGTRGDVEPYVALGDGLRRAGHSVRLAAHARYRALVTAHGLDFVPLPGDPDDFFRSEVWQGLVVSPWRWVGHVRSLRAMVMEIHRRIGPEHVGAACDGVDGVIFTPNTVFGHWAAVDRGVPSLMATSVPGHTTAEFPQPIMAPALRAGRLANRLTYVIAERVGQHMFREPLRPSSRAEIGLPRMPLRGASPRWPPFPVVHGYSPALVPRPADWPPHVHQTGFWHTAPPAGSHLPPALERFLDAGEVPLYVSLGSMLPREGERLLEVVLRAVELAGRRLVLGSGFGEMARAVAQDDVVTDHDAAHDLLLPRVRGIVHHGGSGTTARGLRAGLPTLVVPFMFDQFFWGRRVAAIGAGPAPVPRQRMTVERLVRALAVLERPAVEAAAARVGERLRAEDGVTEAVRIAERVLSGGR